MPSLAWNFLSILVHSSLTSQAICHRRQSQRNGHRRRDDGDPASRTAESRFATSGPAKVEAIKGLEVNTDATKLRQVLLNVLSNAVKYNRDQGRVTVNARFSGDDRQVIIIEIADSGLGIPEAQLEEVFEPFTRLRLASNDVTGTGLGLATSRKLLALMGGTIEASSSQLGGSVFRMCLPGSAGTC